MFYPSGTNWMVKSVKWLKKIREIEDILYLNKDKMFLLLFIWNNELCTIPLSSVNFAFMFQYVSANVFTQPREPVKRFYSNAQANNSLF